MPISHGICKLAQQLDATFSGRRELIFFYADLVMKIYYRGAFEFVPRTFFIKALCVTALCLASALILLAQESNQIIFFVPGELS